MGILGLYVLVGGNYLVAYIPGEMQVEGEHDDQGK